MKVQPISYSSNSLLSAQTNQTDSPIKTKLDNWYQSNLTNYSSYIADETFCNDRSIMKGSGYKIDIATYYQPYYRVIDNKNSSSLKCNQENDKFRVSNARAKLDYPIGLITRDEATLAGTVYNVRNTNYYLYQPIVFYTLSPIYFSSLNSESVVWSIFSGSFTAMGNVSAGYSIRPVINLKSDVIISKGDGSSINPFVVKAEG